MEHLKSNPVIFHHIPKTGGTTFWYYVRQGLIRNGYKNLISDTPRVFDFIYRKDLNRFGAFGGHSFYFCGKYIKKDLRRITLLREPIERAMSHRKNVMIRKGHYYNADAKGMSLYEFITNDSFRPLIYNFQTRYLGMDEPKLGYKMNSIELQKYLETVDIDMKKALHNAKERIKNFYFVGFQDEFSKSIVKFCSMLGIDSPKVDDKKVNYREKLSTKHLKILTDLNEYDLELYNFVKEI